MIPILFSPTEISFTSNGLGRLSDAITCQVTEERNGQYELAMTYPVDGVHFSDIVHSAFIYAIPADGKSPQAFRIYRIAKPINGIVKICAEHISYQTSHIPVSPFTANNVASALQGLKDNAEETCPFIFWTDKTTQGTFTVKAPESLRSRLAGTEGSILDVYGGGEYEFDMYTVKLHQNRGYDRGVTLRYGKNITDIEQEENIASTYTGVMPYWTGTDTDNNEIIVMLDEKVLHSSNAANFPYQRTVPLDLTGEFSEQPTKAQLRTRAQAYMAANNIGVPSVSIKVSFVALWQTEEYKDIANLERVNLCDTVNVLFPKLNISATAKVVKTVYNVLQDRYDSIELGEAKSTLAQTIRSDISNNASKATEDLPSKSYLRKALERATQLLTGGLGGYVVFNCNANGEPQELLIMDTDDIQTAVNVIRINKNGIGFSTNGYEGPFVSAWTIDGRFNADFIAAGSVSANIINGGVLTLGGLNNSNGLMRIKDGNGNIIGVFDSSGIELTGEMEIANGDSHFFLGENDLPTYRYVDGLSNYRTKGSFTKLYYNNTLWGVSCDVLMKTGQRMDHYEEVKVTKCTHFVKMIGVNADILENTGQYDTKAPFLLIDYDGSVLNIESNRDTAQGGTSWQMSFYDGHLPQYASSSSKRYKHDVGILKCKELDPHRLLVLPVKEFIYNSDHPLQYEDMDGQLLPGFIAEDIEEIYPSAVIHDLEGNVESWDERRIIPGMLSLIQEQHKDIINLKKELSEIKEILKGLKK